MTPTIRIAALGFSLTIAMAAACGGDTVVDDGEGEVVDQAGDEGTSTGSAGGSSSSSGSGEPTCGAGDVNFDDACETCIATSCTAAALACCEKPGCLDVVRCAAETGCSSADCYTPENCQDEINTAGIDVALGEASDLGDCALAECAVECDREE